MDLSWVPAALISIGGLIGGAIYAQKRGLPQLRARAELETDRLVRALEGRLEQVNAELALLQPKYESARSQIEVLETEVERLEKRISKLMAKVLKLENGDA